MSEVSCEHVRDALRLGQIPLPPALLAHAEACGECSLLLADDAALGKALTAESGALETEALPWAGFEALVNEEVGFRAWLRSRPNPVRFLVAVAAFALVTALGLRHLRSDFALVPALELGGLLAAFAFFGGIHDPAGYHPAMGRSGHGSRAFGLPDCTTPHWSPPLVNPQWPTPAG